MIDWVLAPVVTRDVGYSQRAIDAKRRDGAWLNGTHWRKAPDGRIIYNLKEIQRWMSGEDEAFSGGGGAAWK